MAQTLIAVVGGNRCTPEEARIAEEVGRLLAAKGIGVLCGGLGGIMESVSKGAKEGGGLTVGILPGDSRAAANRYVDVPIVTGMGHARNVILVKSARAIIAIDGSYGTLSEIAHALQNGVPVIGLGTWSITLKGQPDQTIIRADSPQDAVNKALTAAESTMGE